jgi:hypothetical protein
MPDQPPSDAALRPNAVWYGAFGIDLDRLGADDGSTFLVCVEHALRMEADAIEAAMRALRSRHIEAAEARKGEMVPKFNGRGEPVCDADGAHRVAPLIIRHHCHVERRRAADGGLTFPRFCWFKLKGSPATAGPREGRMRRIPPSDRVRLPEEALRHKIGAFLAANPVERALIDATEAEAAPLRARAKLGVRLWAAIQAHRKSQG